MRRTIILIFAFLLFCWNSFGTQKINPDILNKVWPAVWISIPKESPREYGVYLFRKNFIMEAIPKEFIVHASADNRYKLYINGILVSLGPARGDFNNWQYESIDISHYLQIGKNTIAAVVWNFSDYAGLAQISFRTGFILQANIAAEHFVNTNSSWKCIRNMSYSPLTQELYFGVTTGPGEKIDYNLFPDNWEKVEYDDNKWAVAEEILKGVPKGLFVPGYYGWSLVPREIPAMDLSYQRINILRKSENVNNLPKDFPFKKGSILIQANSRVTLLFDQTFITVAYPVVVFSRGKDSHVQIKYAESLYIKGPTDGVGIKGNRNNIDNKQFYGIQDQFVCSGKENVRFETLWWRSFRYIQMIIETKSEPLLLEDLYLIQTGYPFQLNARFESDNTELAKILEIGWRTVQCCANETYMDCPYYEQLQYIGDTRIQGLVSLYNSGDYKLLRNAIEQFQHSVDYEGLTKSRWPSSDVQLIPTFSLVWIGMIKDYWMYRGDSAFICSMIPAIRNILNFYSKYQTPDGSLSNVPYWSFTDWVKQWETGIPPKNKERNSALLDLQLLIAIQTAKSLENDLGLKCFSDLYEKKEKRLKQTIKLKYWDKNKNMFSDTDEMKYFSQHTNALAVLSGSIEGVSAEKLLQKVLYNKDIAQCSIYFRFYLNMALNKTGLGNELLNSLDPWIEQMSIGLSTWSESPEPSRSDCHAWGSSLNIEFYRTVLGIDTDAPGFMKVKIEPHLGNLKSATGSIPHPKGEIHVSYKFEKNKKWLIEIRVPEKVTGNFIWRGHSFPIRKEITKFELL